jgi:single-strand DNA-binding protein
MNNVVLIGRLTRDPRVNYTNGAEPMAVARYTLAVDRRGRRNGDANQTADFISCVAFAKQGEFAEKYLHQGMKIAVVGHIQTGSYTNKDGAKVYTTDVVVDNHEFVESKGAASGMGFDSGAGAPSGDPGDGFMNIPDGIDEELPFH